MPVQPSLCWTWSETLKTGSLDKAHIWPKCKTYHQARRMKTLAVDVAITRYCQSRMKYPQRDRAISPTAQSPIHPQNVLHSGVTSSSGRTKFTTSTPVATKSETSLVKKKLYTKLFKTKLYREGCHCHPKFSVRRCLIKQ